MFFSPSSQQALRALIYLARQESDQPVLVRDIARAEAIPHPFLSKLMHRLRNRGIVNSTRGPGGGYTLALPADRIVLTDVVETFDGTRNIANQCILGLQECHDANPCALHERWKVVRSDFEQRISSMTLQDLSHGLERKSARKKAVRKSKPHRAPRKA